MGLQPPKEVVWLEDTAQGRIGGERWVTSPAAQLLQEGAAAHRWRYLRRALAKAQGERLSRPLIHHQKSVS